MAKNRNKKKERNGVAPMDLLQTTVPPASRSQGDKIGANQMDTSEIVAVASTSGAVTVKSSLSDAAMKAKKGRPMKRTKNVRKKLAIAKAVSKTEQVLEKVSKKQNKISRTQSAKLLYE